MRDTERIEALDGIMEYSLAGFGGAGGNYVLMTTGYINHFQTLRSVVNSIQRRTEKKIYLFGTFQAAYDDTLVVPKRDNPPVYPRTRDEIIEHARLVQLGLKRWKIFDAGPLIVWSELPEGAAILPTIPRFGSLIVQ